MPGQIKNEDLENFLNKISNDTRLFELYEKIGLYGSKAYLIENLKTALAFGLEYLNVEFPEFFRLFEKYSLKQPAKEFEAINQELYQDKMLPVVMTLQYAFSESFLLRKVVKQELLYLAFKLASIKKIFIAGIGSGEILKSIAQVPFLKNPEEIYIKAVDISQPVIDFCRYRVKEFKFNLDLETADLDCYSFLEDFDLVEISETLEHLKNPAVFLTEAGRHSKLILATIPICLGSPDHLHIFDLHKIKNLIYEAKLEVLYETIRNSFFIPQFFYFAILKQPA